MKVVLFASAYAPAVGGVEELTRRLAQQLRARGDDVEVWTIRHPATLPARETIEGTDVRRFALALPRMSAAPLARFPRTAGTALARLLRAGAQMRPDVVHVQCFSANGVYATALTALLRVPLVVTLQGETVMDDTDIYEHSATLRAGLRAGLRRADAVTACSRFVLDDAERRFGLGEGRGAVVPNGVDLERGEPRSALELPFERFVLGLGRLVEKKGFDLLLDAFARIAAEHPAVGLVIGGDGPAREGLRARAQTLGLGDRVVLPGTLSRGQVAWAMANAAAFVLPSRVEPFGIVVLEALQAGRPVVVSSRGGAPEIVRDGREGLVVDPFDTATLARAIGRLLEDGALGRRLALAAVARAEAFSWELIGERYRAIYRDVAA
jgi:glycogen(starch) synthase